MDRDHGVGSEVGRLRTVVLHRPGAELRRLTPRNNDDLLFDGVPWLERAQQEHDRFAATLREHEIEVLYLHELLAEVLAATRRARSCSPARCGRRRSGRRSRPRSASTWPRCRRATSPRC